MKRFHTLDAIRGIAALAVVGIHSKSVGVYLEGGAIAVDFFFILSGFVLHHAYFRDWDQSRLIPFIRARVIRLAPLALFMILTMFAYSIFVSNQITGSYSVAFLSNALLLNNVGFPGYHVNPPSWSISAEMWVGVAFAGLLVGKRAWVLLLGLVSYVLLFTYAGTLFGISDTVWGFIPQGILRCLGGVCLGYLVYLGYDRLRELNITTPQATALEVSLVLSLVMLVFGQNYIRFWQFMAIPIFAAVIFVFAYEAGAVSRLLQFRPFLFLGAISYAVYLGHYLFVYLGANLYRYFPHPVARIAFYYGGVITFGWLMHRLVELPAASLLKSNSPRRSSVVAYGAAGLIALVTLFGVRDIRVGYNEATDAASSAIEATQRGELLAVVGDGDIEVSRVRGRLIFVHNDCTWTNTLPKVLVHFRSSTNKLVRADDFYFRPLVQSRSGTCVREIPIPPNAPQLRTGTYVPNGGRLTDSGLIALDTSAEDQ